MNPYAGSIINEGQIFAAQHGLIALIAPSVVNKGLIQANLGHVILASGNSFTITFSNDGLINFTIDEETTQAGKDKEGNTLKNGVLNTGSLIANGGKILVTGKTASDILDRSINMKGVAQANSVEEKNGEIIFNSENGAIEIAGETNVSGKNSGEKGGTVKVLGKIIAILDDTFIDASGDAGGGTILIGGNAYGAGPETNATYTYFSPTAIANAAALSTGDGGNVVIWANDVTQFYGSIIARGGDLAGNGGWVETSGHYLDVNQHGIIDLRAPRGTFGTWLLDPSDVTINDSATSSIVLSGSGPYTYTPSIGASTSTLNAGDLGTQLALGNVTVVTTSTGGGNGDITYSASAVTQALRTNWGSSAATTLTLNAERHISFTTALTLDGSGKTINLNAGQAIATGNVSINAALNGDFALNIAAGSSGSITLGAALGGTTPLTSITTNNVATAINGNITTSGSAGQVYNGPATINANRTFTAAAGTVTFANTLDSSNATARTLTVNTTGTTTFGGAVGATNSLSSITTNAGGSTVINGGSMRTTGSQTYNDAVSVGGVTTFTSTGGSGDILLANASNNLTSTPVFSGSIRDLSYTNSNASAAFPTIPSSLRNVTFNFSNAGIDLAAITTTGTLSVTANGTITQSGVLAMTGTTSLAAGSANDITLTNSGNDFGGAVTITSGNNVSLTDTNALTFTTATTNGGLNATAATTITSTGALSLGGGTSTFTSTGNNNIGFNSTLNGATDLTVNTTGNTTFTGIVGGTTAVKSILTNAGGTTNLNANLTTTHAQTYHDAVVLTKATALGMTSTTNNGAITFDTTVDLGAVNTTPLTVSSGSGAITFSNAIGSGVNGALGAIILNSTGATTLSSTLNAASLTTNAGGTTTLSGGTITTSGSQTYNDAVIMGANTAFNTTNTAVNFASTLDRDISTARNLTINSGSGAITLTGDVGFNGNGALGTVDLNSTGTTTITGRLAASSLTTNAGGTTSLGTTTINTNNDILFNDAVTLTTAAKVLTSSAGNITFNSTLSGGFGLTLSGNTGITFNGIVGATALANLDITGATTINTTAITTSGLQRYRSAVILGGNLTFTTTNNSITFDSSIDRDASVRNLVASAGSGAITLTGDVGAGINGALGTINLNSTGTTIISGIVSASSLTTNASGTTVLNTSNITTSGNQTYNDAVTLGITAKNLTSNTGSITFASTINGGFGLTLSGNTGVSLSGIIGGTTALANLDITGNTTTGSAVTGITTTGTQRYRSAITLGANLTLNTTNSNITLDTTIDRDGTARTLTTNAGSGNLSFGGNIGAGINGALGALTLNSSGTTTLSGTVNAASITTDSAGNTAIDGGSITTGGSQTFNDAVTLGSNTIFTVTAAASNILMPNTSNNINKIITYATNGVGTIQDISLSNSNASAVIPTLPSSFRNLTLNFANTGMTLPTLTLTGTLTTTAGGDIGQSGALVITGVSTLNSGTNNIILNNTSNNFSTIGFTLADNATIRDINGVILSASTLAGELNVTAGGAITQSGILTGDTLTAKTVLNTGAAITLNNASGNEFNNINLFARNLADSANAAGAISYRDATGFNITGIGTTSTLSLQNNNTPSNSPITQGSSLANAITVTGTTTLIGGASNDISLTNIYNNFGTIAITSGNHVSLTDSTAMTLGTSTVSGALNIISGGNVTQSGATILTIAGTPTWTVTAANSDILLGNANVFSTTPVFTNNGNIRDLTLRNTSVGASTPIIPSGIRNLSLTFNNAGVTLLSTSLSGTLTVVANGTFEIPDGHTVSTNNAAINITANDFDLQSTGTLTSGTARTTLTQNTAAASIALGNAIGTMTISGAELQRILAGTMTITAASNGQILIDGLTAANTVNIAGITTLNATAGTTASILFDNALSTFTNGLTATTDTTFVINDGAGLHTSNTAISITAPDINLNNTGTLNSGTATTTITQATASASIGLGDTAGTMTISGTELQNITANTLAIVAASNGQIIMDGLNTGNSANINTVSLTATAGTLGSISAMNHSSTFANDLTISTDNALTVDDGVTLGTQNAALTIVAKSLDLNTSGALDSGAGTISIRGNTGDVDVGNTNPANNMKIDHSMLQRMTANTLTIANTGATNLIIDGVTAADVANIADTITFDATNNTNGMIYFQNNASTFKAMTALSQANINVNVPITTTIGNLTLNANTIGTTGFLNLSADLTASGSMTLSAPATSGTAGIILLAPVSLTGTGITISSALDGAYDLTLIGNNTGDITINANWGETTRLGSLTIRNYRNLTSYATIQATSYTQDEASGVTLFNNTGLQISGHAILEGNETNGNINVGSLTINLSYGQLFGFVNGLSGENAIREMQILNTIIPGRIYFDHIDIASVFPPTPPTPHHIEAPAQIVFSPLYHSDSTSLYYFDNTEGPLLENIFPISKNCVRVSDNPQIDICSIL